MPGKRTDLAKGNARRPFARGAVMQATRSNDDKLAQLILYIARASEGDPGFGATKLNKLLFYADFLAYLYLGASITGQEYQALEQGPAPRRLPIVMKRLVDRNEVIVAPTPYHGHRQMRAIACREPELDQFSARQIELVAELIRENRGRNARHMSDRSHRFVGWQLAAVGETIPYAVVFASEREPTREEIEYGRSLKTLASKRLANENDCQGS